MQDNFERKWEQRHTQALRDTAESLQLGRATAHVVSMQSEQLDRSERLVDETEASVAMSKRVLRGMTWSGWIYNQFSVAPQLLGNKEPAQITMGFICPDCKVKFHSADQLETHYDKLHARISNLKQKGNSFPDHQLQCLDETQKQGTEANKDVHDQFLRDLEPQLAELKDQALALGGALETQNEQLDRLDTKIERVHHNLKQVSIDADHMAKRKGRKRFRFRCAFQEIETEKFLQDVNGEARVSADVVVDGCTFRAYTLGDNSDVWGFQSERSSRFLGINRYGTLKVQGFDFKTYEQFLVDSKSRTPLFCMSSYFGLGGWVAMTGSVNDRKLTVVRGTLENKSQAAFFRIFHLEEETTKKERK